MDEPKIKQNYPKVHFRYKTYVSAAINNEHCSLQPLSVRHLMFLLSFITRRGNAKMSTVTTNTRSCVCAGLQATLVRHILAVPCSIHLHLSPPLFTLL